MKKISLNQKFDRKIAENKFDFYKNFKFFLIAGLALIIVGIFIFSFFGFNLGNDFASLSTIKIYTNTEGYSSDFKVYNIDDKNDYNKVISIINNTLSEKGSSIESSQKTTIDILDKNIKDAKAIEVTFYNDSALSEDEQIELNAEIKIALMQAFGYETEDSILLERAVSDAKIITSYNNNSTTIYSTIIALVVAVLFAIIYMVCRYEKPAFVTGFLTYVFDQMLLLSVLAITRIPFNLATLGVVVFTFFMSTINLLVFYSKSKELTASGAVDKFKVSAVANEVGKANIKFNSYLYGILFILSIVLIAVSTIAMRYVALAFLVAIIVNFFSSQFILCGLYSIAYKPVKKNRKFI